MRIAILILLAATPLCAQTDAEFDAAFVSIAEVDSTITVEARYHGSHNFIGRPITGYEAPKCLLTRQAAVALAEVQADLMPFGLGLKTYDCYRPQRAVNDFVVWARDLDDTAMKQEFYPEVPKTRLFSDGYIADRSGHSRGSTIDLTVIPRPSLLPDRPSGDSTDCRLPSEERVHDNSIEMGTAYDCFDPLSHTENGAISAEARRNRLLLKAVMEKNGFTNYPQEWWHFTLRAEPFQDRYWDIPVR